VVKSGLLLMVQILVEWTLVRSVHLVHLVHVRVHLVHVMAVVAAVVVVIVASSMIVPVVEIPCQITVIFLVVSRIAVPVGVSFDEPESNAENDVETGGKLDLSEELAFLQHFEVASKSEQAIRACLMLWPYSTALDNGFHTPI
jgi:hypothetical protein